MLKTTLNRRAPTRRGVAVVLVALLAVTLSVATFRLAAQGPSTLSGYVYDTSGLVLPGVEVVLEDERQVRWSVPSDGLGRFEFAPVGTGRFVLEAELPGFRTLRHELELSELGRWRRDITLQVGELEETVTVTARRPEAAPAATQSSSTEPVRVGGNIRPPRKVEDVNRSIQRSCVRQTLRAWCRWKPSSPRTAPSRPCASSAPRCTRNSRGPPRDAVGQWRFTPTLLNGAPVEVRMAVSVRFSLSD